MSPRLEKNEEVPARIMDSLEDLIAEMQITAASLRFLASTIEQSSELDQRPRSRVGRGN